MRRDETMSDKFPSTLFALEQSGYRRECYSRCKGCERPMEWWETPGGKRIPMDPMVQPGDAAVAHFATCPKAAEFRKKKPPQAVKPVESLWLFGEE